MTKFRTGTVVLLILLIILGLGFALRVYNLGSRSFWGDEAFSIKLVKESTAWELFTGKKFDVCHGPTYAFVLNSWTALFPISEFRTRFLSVVFGVLSIFMMYILGKKLFNVRTGLISALLLAVNATHVHFSQEVRMYGLVTLLTLCSVYYFVMSLEEGGRKHWIFYTLFTFLAVFTHYFAILLPIVQGSYLIVKNNRGALKNWLRTQAVIAVLFLYWVPTFLLKQIRQCGSQYLKNELFYVGPNIFLRLFRFFFGNTGNVTSNTIFYCLFFGTLLIIGVFSCKSKHRNRVDQKLLLLLWLFLPIIIIFIISNFFLGVINNDPNYLLFVSPAFYLLVSRGISRAKKLPLIVILLLLFTFLSVNSLLKEYSTPTEEWKEVTKYLETHAFPGDLILIHPGWQWRAFDYYYQGNLTWNRTDKYNVSQARHEGYKRVWVIFPSREITSDIPLKKIGEIKFRKQQIFIYVVNRTIGPEEKQKYWHAVSVADFERNKGFWSVAKGRSTFSRLRQTQGTRSLKISLNKSGKIKFGLWRLTGLEKETKRDWRYYTWLEFDIYSPNVSINKIHLKIHNKGSEQNLVETSVATFSTDGIEPNQWHHIRIEFDKLNSTTRDAITELIFHAQDVSAGFYVDDIQITTYLI